MTKSELNERITRCKEFIRENKNYLVVHIGKLYDAKTKEKLKISDIDTLLRLSGYGGILILDGEDKDDYFLIDPVTRKMTNFYGEELEYFLSKSKVHKIIEFKEYVQLHIAIYGKFANYFSRTTEVNLDLSK